MGWMRWIYFLKLNYPSITGIKPIYEFFNTDLLICLGFIIYSSEIDFMVFLVYLVVQFNVRIICSLKIW